MTRGEPRYVHLRQPRCRFLSLARVCPTAMPPRAPHHRACASVHSEDRRARVEGPSEGRVSQSSATISRACLGCMRFVAHADGVPLLGDLRTSAVIGGATRSGGCRFVNVRPTEVLVPTTLREERRLPGDRDVFHRHEREGDSVAEGLLLPAFAPALSLTPPTLCPQAGESAFAGALQASRCGHPRVRDVTSRGRAPLLLAGTAAPGN